ncbi:allophanate hydrolase subunit 1 [Gordonia jinhuaensis]|uniref:Allophanate hydrolase n=1 Tax=Gordonia jinhuaensis TaxID=1517702 RepID=A0A916TD03_9ACTN|nr:carboxyltransferase domain-containing protein [Gordonia jinhuaensis]GGB37903.1 allophanate hydrolase [Gordonia jinhuaensis]
MRQISAGRDAVLLDFSDDPNPLDSAVSVAARLRGEAARGALGEDVDVIGAATTVLVQWPPAAGVNALALHRALRNATRVGDGGSRSPSDTPSASPSATDAPGAPNSAPDHHIDVRYDGADLAEVADTLTASGGDDWSVDDVVRAHTAITWRVQFIGFAPGFGYLVPDESTTAPDHPARRLATIGRRTTSRTRVPGGAVALAAGYSAVYPRPGPGGWNLLGRTEATMFDVHADPPSTLSPGDTVVFRDIGGSR